MSKTVRVICLVFSIALALCCFAGCKQEEETASKPTVSISDMKPTDQIQNTSDNDLPDVDLKGVTLKVACDRDFDSCLFPDPELNELSKRRNDWIEQCKKDYNFDLEYVHYTWNEMTKNLMPDLLTGDYVADFVLPAIRQTGPFIQAGLCANLNESDIAQYLDFSKPWWDQTMLQASTINGKTYACTPQFTSSANTTWVCFFNYKVLEDIGYTPDYLYDLQDKGTWTWDEFHKLCKLAVLDTNDDGKLERGVDRFGFVAAGWHISQCLMTVSGAEYIVTDPTTGNLKYNLDNSHGITAIQKMNEIFTDRGVFHAGLAPVMQTLFSSDQALFMTYQVQACQNEYLRNMESNFGMLLMPKYTADTEYISRAEQTTLCCFIPATCKYKVETAFALQALSYSAWKVGVPDIIELNYAQYVRDDKSQFCIDEVFNHTTFTIDQLLYDVGSGEDTWYKIIDVNLSKPTLNVSNMDVSNAVKTIAPLCQNLLDEFYNQTTENTDG